MSANDIPKHLKHIPIYSVDYKSIDEEGDAKFLSIGYAQWNEERKNISAKVFRKAKSGRWSPQSEELPLWRVVDLAQMICAVIKLANGDNTTNFPIKLVGTKEQLDFLNGKLDEDKLIERLKELKCMLNSMNL